LKERLILISYFTPIFNFSKEQEQAVQVQATKVQAAQVQAEHQQAEQQHPVREFNFSCLEFL
jgi:hypothetical protein